MMSTPLGRLRLISLLEAVSFLMLLAFAVYKRTDGGSETGVQIMGPVHGVLFILYVLAALDVRKRLAWANATTAKVLVAAVVPFAPFYVERWLRTRSEPVRAG